MIDRSAIQQSKRKTQDDDEAHEVREHTIVEPGRVPGRKRKYHVSRQRKLSSNVWKESSHLGAMSQPEFMKD